MVNYGVIVQLNVCFVQADTYLRSVCGQAFQSKFNCFIVIIYDKSNILFHDYSSFIAMQVSF